MARQESERRESLVFRDTDQPRSGGLSASALRGFAAEDRALTHWHATAASGEMLKDIALGREL